MNFVISSQQDTVPGKYNSSKTAFYKFSSEFPNVALLYATNLFLQYNVMQ